MERMYNVPAIIIDEKEARQLDSLTDAYNKMLEPTKLNKAVAKIGDKIPTTIKEFASEAKIKVSENEIFLKALEVLGKGFQTIEEYAAKLTLSENQIINQLNKINSETPIISLNEICLLRGYDISKAVNKVKLADIGVALVEGAATGAPGFAGIPFNLVLSTFLYYRAVQSVALFYGYDIKNDPAELQIASEVFMNALSPKSNNESELSGTIAKIMLLTTASSVKQTVQKGWVAMAEKGGVHLLITQMRALAHASARKALEKAGKKGLEKTVFTEVFEQVGKKLTQKTISRTVPVAGAVIGATIDTAQMIQIIKYADIFYNKRFILEKELRIKVLTSGTAIEVKFEDVEQPTLTY